MFKEASSKMPETSSTQNNDGESFAALFEQSLPTTKFAEGDVIVSVNGTELMGRNPLVILGEALTKAEATDGRLTFDVKPVKEGAPAKVTIAIPVLGTYGPTFPLDCAKSQKIIGCILFRPVNNLLGTLFTTGTIAWMRITTD